MGNIFGTYMLYYIGWDWLIAVGMLVVVFFTVVSAVIFLFTVCYCPSSVFTVFLPTCEPFCALFLVASPRMGPGHPLSPLVHSLPRLLLFFTFPFSQWLLLLSIPFLSTRIVPFRFQAGGRRKRPNLALVCSFYFVLSVFLS